MECMLNDIKFSIKSKLFIAVCITAAICVSLPLGFAYYLLKADLAADAQSDMQERLELARRIYYKDLNNDLEAKVSTVSSMLGQEVAYVSGNGALLVSASWLSENWNFLNRSEIREAGSEGFGFGSGIDSVNGKNILYGAIKIEKSPGVAGGYLMIEQSLSLLSERMGMIRKVFYFALPIVALVCYGVIRFVTMQLTSSVQSMVRTAQAVGQGNYKRRIRTYPDKEFIPLAEAINWMAERIDEHVGIITSQKNKIQAVLNGMWDGVMVLDSRGRVQSTNRALVGIFPGIQDSVGRSPLEIIPSPELQDACMEIISPEGPEARTVQVVLPSGQVYDVNIVSSSSTTDPGQGPGAIAVFHDISEIKRLETVRQDFVANVSHELRTPLTSIKGYAETLLGDPPPPESVRNSFLGTILKNANHMTKIVDDLLNLSRLEGSSGKGDFVEMDPAEALEDAWAACTGLASKRNVAMDSSLKRGMFLVKADSDQLVQLFRNLLENAIKYGPENKPVVVDHHIEEEMLKISVQDEGIGIPAADQSRIFERFYSVEKYRRNEFGSTGLGLAISRHIVSNHSGEIEVQSPPEGSIQGTAFVFTIPLERVCSEKQETA